MQKLIRKRMWFLAAMLAMTAFLSWGASLIETEFSFDNFRSGRDGEVEFYEAYRDSFAHEENIIQIALKAETATIWDSAFLATVDHIFQAIDTIPNVDSVISPTSLQYLRWTGLNVIRRPIIRYNSAKQIEQSKDLLSSDSILYSNFFSEDRQYACGLVLVNPEIMDTDARDDVSREIDKVLESIEYEFIISGIPYIRTQYVGVIKGEMASFIILSVALTLVVMFFLYRNFWGVVLPIVVVVLSIVWTIGFMSVTGKPLDMLANLVPTIMFVVGIADTIHLVTRYQQDLSDGLEGELAMQSTLTEIGAAILLTSLTTAIGFASLVVSPLAPIKSFGLYAAAGVLFAFIISMILVPTALLWAKPEKIRNSKGWVQLKFWEIYLDRLYHFVKRNPWPIVGGTVALLILCGVGISKVSFNTYLLDDISKNDPAKVSMEFFENNFYGSRPLEMAIMPKEGHRLLDIDVLQDIDTLQKYLRSRQNISPFLSVVTYLKTMNKLTRGGSRKQYRLPETQAEVEELMGYAYLSDGGGKLLDRLMTPGRTMGRLSARMSDIGSYAFADFRTGIDSFLQVNGGIEKFDYHLTGSPIIVEENVEVLRKGLFQGLTLAFVLVALLMGLLFKSVRMLIIGVVPNVIPLLVTGALMGFMGITLRASTSIVFLIAFGVAVDDTIHFLGRLRIELSEGRDLETAIRNTVLGTGKALVLTTIILIAGFSMLLTSDFGGTFSVGLFTTLTLMVALFADLLLLPVLVRWSGVGKDRSSK